MQTPQISHFLVFCYDTNEWHKTTLDDLSQVNEPNFNIIPVYQNGEYGAQTTWGAFLSATKTQHKNKKGFWQSVGAVLTADLTAPIKQQIEREKKAEEAEKKPVYERDMPTGSYYYEVITHNKYIKSSFDAAGLKNKINRMSQKGFKLVAFGTVSGFPSFEESMQKIAVEAFLGGDSSVSIQDYKIAVAIMEKQIIRAEQPSILPLAAE